MARLFYLMAPCALALTFLFPPTLALPIGAYHAALAPTRPSFLAPLSQQTPDISSSHFPCISLPNSSSGHSTSNCTSLSAHAPTLGFPTCGLLCPILTILRFLCSLATYAISVVFYGCAIIAFLGLLLALVLVIYRRVFQVSSHFIIVSSLPEGCPHFQIYLPRRRFSTPGWIRLWLRRLKHFVWEKVIRLLS